MVHEQSKKMNVPASAKLFSLHTNYILRSIRAFYHTSNSCALLQTCTTATVLQIWQYYVLRLCVYVRACMCVCVCVCVCACACVSAHACANTLQHTVIAVTITISLIIIIIIIRQYMHTYIFIQAHKKTLLNKSFFNNKSGEKYQMCGRGLKPFCCVSYTLEWMGYKKKKNGKQLGSR